MEYEEPQAGNDLPSDTVNTKRRQIIHGAGLVAGGSMLGLATGGVWAAGSDKPEKEEIKIGFIPLTDCASVVMASVLGFDKKYGVKFVLSKEASWAGVRDKLANGDLDAAHVLYGLLYGVQMGIGGQKKDMAVLMQTDKREYTFAQTFPTGTHAMWLYYWLAANGINPMKDAKVITVPPPQMVANMRVGNMDGFCVGEPWGHRAIMDGVGITATTTQDIWKDHPEKVLGSTLEFAKKYPNTCRAMMAAILDAGKWIDASLANKNKMAEVIADKSYVNTSKDAIDQRIMGRYQNGLGKTWDDPNYMKFYNDGLVNFPYLSDGMWFMTQHRRWGLLKDDPDYLAVATSVNQIDLYKDAAAMTKTPVPKSQLRTRSEERR